MPNLILPGRRLRRRWQTIAFAVIAVLLALAPARGFAQTFMYISDGNFVDLYNFSTHTLNGSFISVTSATGVAVDSTGNVYVGSTDLPDGGSGIMKYNGTTGAQIGAGPFVGYEGHNDSGPDPIDVTNPAGMKFSTSGNLYVADESGASNVHIYSSTGVSQGNLTGGDLTSPTGVAFDSGGNLVAVGGGYVARSLGATAPFTDLVAPGTGGSPPNGNLTNPISVAVRSNGQIYVIDTSNSGGNGAVLRFNSDGSFDTDLIQFTTFVPADLSFGPDGLLYVSGIDIESNLGEILAYSKDGAFVQAVISGGFSSNAGPTFFVAIPEPSTWMLPSLLGLLLLLARKRLGRLPFAILPAA